MEKDTQSGVTYAPVDNNLGKLLGSIQGKQQLQPGLAKTYQQLCAHAIML